MASNVIVNFLGDASKLDKTIGGVESRLGKLAGFVGTAAVAAGAAAVGAAATSVAAYADFDGRMREVYTLMPGMSQKAMRSMEDDVFSFSKKFGTLPNDVIPALYDSLSAGVPPDNVFSFLETSAKFAKAGATDVSTAVDSLTTVVNAFGLGAEGAGRAADVLFTAVKQGKTTVPELSASLFQVAPIAAAMGVSIEDVAASLSSLTAQGVPTAAAATQMKSVFAELGKQGTKADKVFRDVAGKSFPDFIKAGGNTADAMRLLEKAAADNNVSVMDLFGSIEAGQGALALTGEQAGRFATNLAGMQNAAGATDEAFKVMDRGLMATWNRVKANVTVTMLQIGRFLAPYVAALVDEVGVLFGRLVEWWNANGPTIIAGVISVKDAIVGWINDVRPLIESWVQNVLQSVTDWWNANGPAIIVLAQSLAAGIEGAFRLIQDAIQFVIDKWDEFKIAIGVGVAIMTPHWVALAATAVTSAATQVTAWVTTQAAAIKSAVVHSAQVLVMVAKWALLAPTAVGYALLVVGAWISTQVAAIQAAAIATAQVAIQVAKWVFLSAQAMLHAARIAAAWLISMGPIALVIAAVVGLVVVIVRNWETIKSTISAGWEAVKGFTSSAWESIKTAVSSAITSVISFFSGLPGRIVGALGSLGSLLFNKGVEIVQGLINGIKSMAGAAASAVANAIPGGGVIKGVISKIPGFARGVNNFAGGLAIVGEEGPELVHLPKGSDVITADKTKRTLATTGSNGDGLTRADMEEIAMMLIDGIVNGVGQAADKSARAAVQTVRAR